MEIATKIAPIGLALIMLTLGFGLTIQDFLRVIKIPKDFLIGFICQLILLPIVALIIILLLNPIPEIAVGLMLIACAPGGVTSNVITKFADGDVALSVSLTAVTSLISIITVPLIIFNSINFFEIDNISKDISMFGIALKMFFVVTVPIIIGMIIRHFLKDFITSRAILFQRFSIIIFALVFIAIYVSEWDRIITFIVNAGIIALILNLTMMILSFYIAKFFASGVAQQRSISIESGLQNGTLAAFVGTQIFGETGVMTFIVPSAAYVLIMMTTSMIFVFILRKNT
jgi:BASS family bile acid:Na+ symporter|tara:strand:- start:1181 stop:2038 length:858 start_codon:yes stop_codon:yes gene_type:complete